MWTEAVPLALGAAIYPPALLVIAGGGLVIKGVVVAPG